MGSIDTAQHLASSPNTRCFFAMLVHSEQNFQAFARYRLFCQQKPGGY